MILCDTGPVIGCSQTFVAAKVEIFAMICPARETISRKSCLLSDKKPSFLLDKKVK